MKLELTSSSLLRFSPNRYEFATHDKAVGVAQSTPEVVVHLTTVSFTVSSLQKLEVHWGNSQGVSLPGLTDGNCNVPGTAVMRDFGTHSR